MKYQYVNIEMVCKVMVTSGYNLTELRDYRDGFKSIRKLLELNLIYRNSLHSIFKAPKFYKFYKKHQGGKSHGGRYINTEQFVVKNHKISPRFVQSILNGSTMRCN